MSDLPYNLDLTVVTGDYGSYSLTYTDDDYEAIDTTGWEFSFYAKESVDDLDSNAFIKLDNGDFTNGGATGIITFKVLARDTAGEPIKARDLFYQIKVIYDSAGYDYPQTHFEGTLAVTQTSKKAV